MKVEPRETRFSCWNSQSSPTAGTWCLAQLELNRPIIAADALNLLKGFDDIWKCSKCLLIGCKLLTTEELQVEKKWRQIQIFVERQNVAIGAECVVKEKVNSCCLGLQGFSVALGMRMIRMLKICCGSGRKPIGILWRCFGQMSISADGIRPADNPSECYEYQMARLKLIRQTFFFFFLGGGGLFLSIAATSDRLRLK